MLMTLLAACFLGKEIIKESLEKPLPKNWRFDEEAYYRDINNPNLSMMDIVRKRQKNAYVTTAPKPEPVRRYPTKVTDIINVAKYEEELKVYGKDFVERRRKFGAYLK